MPVNSIQSKNQKEKSEFRRVLINSEAKTCFYTLSLLKCHYFDPTGCCFLKAKQVKILIFAFHKIIRILNIDWVKQQQTPETLLKNNKKPKLKFETWWNRKIVSFSSKKCFQKFSGFFGALRSNYCCLLAFCILMSITVFLVKTQHFLQL